eukprot:CAMPEP_0195539066 /NCGR_PEP_ID=MMETSP0794_2-20130614/49859_1 /TAXON_ID=515487 /ORGANISM="Stephanopyxis turris, Strain CCMP 815" /LENGTH=282 /DNA_ID=CAMNT_0040673083 /DNA_START=166 /DNA_END=1011 /DNA_ORIENTATION=-
MTPIRPQTLDHIVLRCHDFQRMFDFYTRILGCTIDREEHVGRFGGALTHLRAGNAYIDLLAYSSQDLTQEGEEALRRMHNGGEGVKDEQQVIAELNFASDTSTVDHICLRVEEFDEKEMRSFLDDEGIEVISSGSRLGADGVGLSVYVKDPEGNVVELKGPPVQPEASLETKAETQNKENNHISDTARDAASEHSENSEVRLTATPCVRICRYNDGFYDGQVCIGCFREGFEIGAWGGMTPVEKSLALLDAVDRCPELDEAIGDEFQGAVCRQELLRQARAW